MRAAPRRRAVILVLVVMALGPALLFAQEGGSSPRIQSVKVTILSTMLADTRGLGEWGFSALVEADGHRLLFDTGARPETVLQNAQELGIALDDVREVILSHHHTDHTGGLLALRRKLSATSPEAISKAYVGSGLFLSRPRADGSESNATIAMREPYKESGGRFVEIRQPTELFPGAWLTGPVPRTHPERNWSGQTQLKTNSGLVEDTIPEDMSLVLDTDRGLVVVSGCGHAGVVNTLEYARKTVHDAPIHAALGGFHLFAADDRALEWTAGHLRSLGVAHLLGAHCTGIESVFALRGRLGLDRRTCVVGAVGAQFDLKTGIQAGTIAR